MSDGQRWYVVHTHAHSEGKAATHLRRQGYAVYLPRVQKRIRHARRVAEVKFFMKLLLNGFSRFPSACAREALPSKVYQAQRIAVKKTRGGAVATAGRAGCTGQLERNSY